MDIRIECAKGGYILHGADDEPKAKPGKSNEVAPYSPPKPTVHTTMDSLFRSLETVLAKRMKK